LDPAALTIETLLAADRRTTLEIDFRCVHIFRHRLAGDGDNFDNNGGDVFRTVLRSYMIYKYENNGRYVPGKNRRDELHQKRTGRKFVPRVRRYKNGGKGTTTIRKFAKDDRVLSICDQSTTMTNANVARTRANRNTCHGRCRSSSPFVPKLPGRVNEKNISAERTREILIIRHARVRRG